MKDLFSFRNGLEIKPLKVKSILEPGDRVWLWNAFTSVMSKFYEITQWGNDTSLDKHLAKRLQTHFFVTFFNPNLSLGDVISDVYRHIEDPSHKNEWWRILNFLEFVYKETKNHTGASATIFQKLLNEEITDALKDGEISFSFVNGYFIPLVNEIEVSEIEKALNNPSIDQTIREKLALAISKIAGRNDHDLGDAIGICIATIEAQICQMSGENRMGAAIKVLRNRQGILSSEFSKILELMWGWSSNEPWIRHGKAGEPAIDKDLAKFVLIQSSAILNLLVAVSEKSTRP